ncbi:hypothetical protein [Paenibacillus agricola]|uniref:Uncharacterized protein n=1 Tax=Paenibacillus agricola TaxID=2716264 RepID=A0ABX0JL44_9BACL|nr:hypothetical protein [Paenibacillus agricola]NHN34871.1 hypothetical protein [Paenibacillus agricola]
MKPLIPLILAFLLLAYMVYAKVLQKQYGVMLHVISIVLLINVAIGCYAFQDWSSSISLLKPSTTMRIIMVVSFLFSAYMVLIGYRAIGMLDGRWGNVDRGSESIVMEEPKTWRDRWNEFKMQIKGIPDPAVNPDADLEGIMFEIGEVVRERER